MPVALITGASRGFGRAVAHDLAAAGWSLVLDARGADDLAAAGAGLVPARTRLLPGDVRTPAHREDLVAAAWDLGGIDLLVNNASHLGPSPQPRLADYEPRDLATRVRRRRAGAARPAAGGAAAAAPVRRDRGERQLRRCCRGLRGLGRLRLGQGRAGPAVGGARRRGARPARLRAGPGRHAHRDAPAGLPRARTSPTGRSPARSRCPHCGRCSSAARRAAATAPPTCCCPRARPGDGRSPPSVRPPVRSATEPPEARGLARDEVRLLVAGPCRVEHATFRDLAGFLEPGDLVVVNTSGTLAAAVEGVRAGQARDRARLDRPGRRHLGGRAAAAGRGPTARSGRPARARSSSWSRAGCTSWSRGRTATRPGPGCGGSGPSCPARSRRTWAGTAGRSPTPTSAATGRCATTRRSSPGIRAAPRCRAPDGRSPTGWSPTW